MRGCGAATRQGGAARRGERTRKLRVVPRWTGHNAPARVPTPEHYGGTAKRARCGPRAAAGGCASAVKPCAGAHGPVKFRVRWALRPTLSRAVRARIERHHRTSGIALVCARCSRAARLWYTRQRARVMQHIRELKRLLARGEHTRSAGRRPLAKKHEGRAYGVPHRVGGVCALGGAAGQQSLRGGNQSDTLKNGARSRVNYLMLHHSELIWRSREEHRTSVSRHGARLATALVMLAALCHAPHESAALCPRSLHRGSVPGGQPITAR